MKKHGANLTAALKPDGSALLLAVSYPGSYDEVHSLLSTIVSVYFELQCPETHCNNYTSIALKFVRINLLL